MDAITSVPAAVNEPVKSYAPGTPERAELEATLRQMADAGPLDLGGAFGAERRPGTGEESYDVVMPSDRHHVLGKVRQASAADTTASIEAALRVAREWGETPFEERAAVFLKAADLLSGPWRARMNAATMLGQAKTPQQAEIDAACELADFLRFNVAFARQILAEQPHSPRGEWNRMDYRPLEGFVYAITPFNFTSIAGNLPTAPAIMGNVALWKPSLTQQFSADVWMRLLDAAGLPKGVVNMLPGHGSEVSSVALRHPALAGIHFTGSTRVFQGLWQEIGGNIGRYASYPRLVGETGGKDFIVAHPSADPDVVRVAMLRGAFEYSGQKCSAASRAYVARSVWDVIKDDLAEQCRAIKVGDVRDFSVFTSAVIDDRAFKKLSEAIEAAKASGCEIVAGGGYDDSAGYFVEPTIITSTDPKNDIFVTEYFGPLLGVYVYEDKDFDTVLDLVDGASSYALTGAIIATDRAAVEQASRRLRFTAGNFYVNDKPTGAVVGCQPFGGARASGTNDKAGSLWNLMRWTSPRAIKENFVPPLAIEYPHMRAE